VNTASRAQAAAEVGQILITQAVYERAGAAVIASSGRDYSLKGFEDPVHLYSAAPPQSTRALQGPGGSG
jgi:class 3 adenylate cyclase